MDKPTFGIGTYSNETPTGMEYKGFDIETGDELFHCNVGTCSKSICDFISIGHGLMYMKKLQKHNAVYNENKTAIEWIEQKKHRASFGDMNSIESHERTQKIEYWIVMNLKRVDVYLWKTDKWDELKKLDKSKI